jgi:hypothetical protein
VRPERPKTPAECSENVWPSCVALVRGGACGLPSCSRAALTHCARLAALQLTPGDQLDDEALGEMMAVMHGRHLFWSSFSSWCVTYVTHVTRVTRCIRYTLHTLDVAMTRLVSSWCERAPPPSWTSVPSVAGMVAGPGALGTKRTKRKPGTGSVD